LPKIQVRQKLLMVFEIRKPACQLCTIFVLTIIMYSDDWSLVEMDRWSVQYQIAAVELCIKTELVTSTQRGFHQQFQKCDALSSNTVLLWVLKWHQEGSLKDSKPQGCPFSAPAPDNVEQIKDAML